MLAMHERLEISGPPLLEGTVLEEVRLGWSPQNILASSIFLKALNLALGIPSTWALHSAHV
jgi:hypothetical protein